MAGNSVGDAQTSSCPTNDPDSRLKIILFGAGLIYSFMGVGIVADIFMSAIERVTSKKKRVRIPGTDRIITQNVWNETVANLTLMALGSSAPEILLAINDILKEKFYSGDLGPATIVGSAAFNLFCIIAVCINAIPSSETRVIKEYSVFVITAIWSIFAYVWLLLIVTVLSPPVIEVWEGVLTVLFFPALVWMSWASDVGLLTFQNFVGCLSTCCCCCCSNSEGGTEGDEEVSMLGMLMAACGRVCSMACKILNCICSAIVSILCCCFRRKGAAQADHEEIGNGEEAVDGTAAEEENEEDDQPILDEDGERIDCEEGVLTFKQEIMEIWVGEEEQQVVIPVLRKNGSEGRISVQFRIESLTATPGYDYEDVDGQLDFKSGIVKAEIELLILPKRPGEKDDTLQLILEDAEGGAILNPETDGGEDSNILTIHLRNERGDAKGCGARMYAFFDGLLNIDELWLGTETWKDQIIEALFVNGSLEDQREAGWLDWVSHALAFPWKINYALLTPPPQYLGGWLCFTFALGHIGLLTWVIGNLAESFGCAASIEDAITAITFVALGTSLPDTFASKTAATQDEYADASIVNVTGSNSVNVFLGIGLPWCMAAIKWKITGTDQQWVTRHGEYLDRYPDGGFVVNKAEDLAFSVLCFTIFAQVCLAVIYARRRWFGGELGGPGDIKACSSFLLFMLWISYIGLQIWKSGSQTAGITEQIVALLVVIPLIFVVMLIFLVLLQVLKISKRYIGEEGFWGIFVAVALIGIRMIVFFMFQTK